MSPLLILLIIGVLVYLKSTGKIKLSWTVLAAIAVGMWLLFGSNLLSVFGPGLNSNASSPADTDACGCGPGQSVAMLRRNMWGKYKPAGTVPCTIALARVNASGKNTIAGCVN